MTRDACFHLQHEKDVDQSTESEVIQILGFWRTRGETTVAWAHKAQMTLIQSSQELWLSRNLSATQIFILCLPDSVSFSLLKFKSMVTTFFAEMEGGE